MTHQELDGYEPDIENGMRLVALLVAKLNELEQRIAQLERERVSRPRQAA